MLNCATLPVLLALLPVRATGATDVVGAITGGRDGTGETNGAEVFFGALFEVFVVVAFF